MVIEWLGSPLGVKFPLVPKIQAGSVISIYGTSDAKEGQVGQAKKVSYKYVFMQWLKEEFIGYT